MGGKEELATLTRTNPHWKADNFAVTTGASSAGTYATANSYFAHTIQ